MDKGTTSAAEKLLQQLKNNKWIARLIVLGVILIALAKFGEAVSKLTAMLPVIQQRKVQFDAYNQEKVLEVAKHADNFFSRALAATRDQIPFPSMHEELREISVELRDLQLRDSVRPLNEVSSQQIRILRENWEGMIDLFREEKTPSPVFLEEKRKQEREFFSMILAFPDPHNKAFK